MTLWRWCDAARARRTPGPCQPSPRCAGLPKLRKRQKHVLLDGHITRIFRRLPHSDILVLRYRLSA